MKDQLSIAAALAVKFHDKQKYGELPYIYHLNCVDQLVISAYAPKDLDHGEPYSKEPGDEIDLLRALAYLHDIKEDTNITDKIILDAGITKELLEALDAITKVKGEAYKDYINKVMGNGLALKVKIADTVSNLTHSIVDQDERRVAKYSKQLSLLKGV